jgi:hypothetical protein
MQTAKAKDTFTSLADLVVGSLQPDGRATATAATLRQLADSAGAGDLPLTPADAAAGFALLAPLRDGDPTPVAARRRTCGELAVLLGDFSIFPADPQRLAAVFRVVAAHFVGSADPRQAAIAETAAREAVELEAIPT